MPHWDHSNQKHLVAFGNHQSPVYPQEQFAEKYTVTTFLPYGVLLVVVVVMHRYVYSYEAPVIGGFRAEIYGSTVECCFLRLEAAVARVCGPDTPFLLVFEPIYIPIKNKILDAIKDT